VFLFLACSLNPEFLSAFLRQVIGEDGHENGRDEERRQFRLELFVNQSIMV
jgi:hypothetical protein